MPGSSRRVRAMSDEQPPAGTLRLARVAGVPVYLDRTWLLLGAFVAWTGWQSGQNLGDGTTTAVAFAVWMVVGILVAVLGHEIAHAVAARLLGFRVHRIVATLWGGHTAYDGTGTTAGRAAVVAVAGPLANLAFAALGSVGTEHPAVARVGVRVVVHVAQPAAGGVQPPARPAARRWPARAVAGVGAHRSPRPRARRGRLVRARARRRHRAVAGGAPARPGQPRPRGRGPRARHGLDPLVGRHRRPQARAPRAAARLRPDRRRRRAGRGAAADDAPGRGAGPRRPRRVRGRARPPHPRPRR